MPEENTEKWDFQKDGKPFDELPHVVKRNPHFLYEYIRTGKLPNIDLIEDLVKCDLKAAKKMIKDAKNHLPMYERRARLHFRKFEKSSGKVVDYPNGKDIFDEFFIESGYLYGLFIFEELYYDMDNFYSERGSSSLKKIEYDCKCFSRKVNIHYAPLYPMYLWWKAILYSAENKLKELEEYMS